MVTRTHAESQQNSICHPNKAQRKAGEMAPWVKAHTEVGQSTRRASCTAEFDPQNLRQEERWTVKSSNSHVCAGQWGTCALPCLHHRRNSNPHVELKTLSMDFGICLAFWCWDGAQGLVHAKDAPFLKLPISPWGDFSYLMTFYLLSATFYGLIFHVCTVCSSTYLFIIGSLRSSKERHISLSSIVFTKLITSFMR